MTDLTGKTVFITGGSSGIGEATAELFAEKGAIIIIADIDDAKGHAVAERLGGRHRFVHLDVTDEAAWTPALKEVIKEFGGLDFLFLNAGVMSRPLGADILDDPFKWITKKSLDKNIAVNVIGPMYGILAAMPLMEGRQGATIILTASGAGIKAYPQDVPYSVSKAGTIFLANCMGALLGPKGIRVLSISPHGIDTPMCPPDLYEKKKRENTFSTPRDMAEAVLYAYEHGKPGEVWCGGHQQAPWRHAASDFIVAGYA